MTLDVLRSVSLRARLGALGILLGVIVLVSAVTTARALDDFSEQRERVLGTLQPALGDTRAALTALVNQETGERGYVITGDDRYLDPYRQGRSDLVERMADLRRLLDAEPSLLEDLAALEESVERWYDVGPRPEIAAVRSGDSDAAAEIVRSGAGKVAFDVVRGDLARLQRYFEDQLEEAQVELNSSLSRVRDTFVATVALVLGLLAVSTVLVRRWVLEPVDQLLVSMRAVSQGELLRPVVAVGPPEVAAVGAGAEAMRRRIVSELDRARAAVEALDQEGPVVTGLRRELDRRTSTDLVGVEVHGEVHAAEGVLAGDWWDVVRRPNGSAAVLVVDVAGHGPLACLLAVRFKQRITFLLRERADLLQALVEATEELLDGEDAEQFLSAVVVEVDPASGEVHYVNAGHAGAMVLRGQGPAVRLEELGPTGPLVGPFPLAWTVARTTLDREDLLLLTTDGITEARDATGRELGTQGVARVLSGLAGGLSGGPGGGLAGHEPQTVVGELLEAVRRFAVDWRRDDVTCVALRRAPQD